MLKELFIKNYALIETLQLQLEPGLLVLSGETGAGKSIIVDALGLLLGRRAESSEIRKGALKCQITGVFQIPKKGEIRSALKSMALENEEESEWLILRRQLDGEGKSRAYVNDKPVSVSALKELGETLVEIHGQNEHQRLLKTSEQRDFLDRYAGNDVLRKKVAELYANWKNYLEQKEMSHLSEQERNQKADLYKFQIQEIEQAKLKIGEEEEIEETLPKLKNVEKLKNFSDQIYSLLYDSEDSVSSKLYKSRRAAESILSLGIELKEVPQLLEEAQARIQEASSQIESFRGNLAADPKKLDELICRLDLIAKLKKKYGRDIPEILNYCQKIREEMGALENYSANLEELKMRAELAEQELLRESKKLSRTRAQSAESLARGIEKELKELGFEKGRFSILLIPCKDANGKEAPTMSGLEEVEFLFSANAGEDLKPLRSVASGGELSRLMLALKKVLAQADPVPTLIFDEIDAGISGSMGIVIGEKLKKLSQSHQVLLITHLPQIAAFAAKQIAVKKEIVKGRSQTWIEELSEEKRVKELARMLGGAAGDSKDPTSTALKHAEELLRKAQ